MKKPCFYLSWIEDYEKKFLIKRYGEKFYNSIKIDDIYQDRIYYNINSLIINEELFNGEFFYEEGGFGFYVEEKDLKDMQELFISVCEDLGIKNKILNCNGIIIEKCLKYLPQRNFMKDYKINDDAI